MKIPPHPDIIGAQRYFARVRTFDTECPVCGLVYRVRIDIAATTWDRRTARFRCLGWGGCGARFTFGMLAWPVGNGPQSHTPPADQVPGPRQLAQIRAEGDGWWMPDAYRHRGRPDPTNLTGAEVRPEPEDATELQLLDTPAGEPTCEYCRNAYNPLKSQAQDRTRYCTQTCQDRDQEE